MAAGFHRIDGQLRVDGLPLGDIADEFGTPLYVYSAAAIEESYKRFEQAVGKVKGTVHYAVKANSNLAVLRVLARLGAGADIVSGGELQRALKAGFEAGSIIFSGVGKTDGEIATALEAGIGQINAESASEVDRVIELAKGVDSPTRLALRINPDVAASTHAKISTGGGGTKFGIATKDVPGLYRRIAESRAIDPCGLAVHIGSQIMDPRPYEAAWASMLELAEGLRADGFDVPMLDLGGGIGVDYSGGGPPATGEASNRARRDGKRPPWDIGTLEGLVVKMFGNRKYRLGFEPGRRLVAEAGVMLVRVLHTKPASGKTFVVVDGAMNDLIRPTLYDAFHRIEPVAAPAEKTIKADIVGPVCETGDYLGLGRELPEVERGDTLAVMHTGAYGAVMRSNYNTRPFASEVMVVDGKAERVSVPQTVEVLLAGDIIPASLE